MAAKFKPVLKDGKLGLAYDGNADGENSVSLNINVDEAIQEALKKGEAIEGEAMVKFKFDPADGFKLSLDSDKDGVPSIDLNVDILEALQEADVL